MKEEKKREWVALLGDYELDGNKLICKGGVFKQSEEKDAPRLSVFLTNELFSDGVINVKIEFDELNDFSICEVVLSYNPKSKGMMLVGLSSLGPMYQVVKYGTTRELIAASGVGSNLKAKKIYNLEISKEGSLIDVKDNDIRVLSTNIPQTTEESNVGISIMSRTDVVIHDFKVSKISPKAFVVMQFTEPYNQFYSQIIKSICTEFGIDVKRGDENFGTGMVLADIIEDIKSSSFVIADISVNNPNVYYEIGYAHALSKPTIILAEKGTTLPFDISPFRVLFYENSIIGRSRFEEGLRSHLTSIIKS